jgi:hypothetical protein
VPETLDNGVKDELQARLDMVVARVAWEDHLDDRLVVST